MKTTLPLALLCFAATSTAFAHDYWLEPARFALPANEPLTVRLFVGDEFESDLERPFQPKPTLRFQLVSKDKTRDLTKECVADKKPLIAFRIAAAGTHLLAMERKPQHITLKAEKFNRYLKHEKLDAALKDRRDAGESDKPGRERYTRYLKSLITVGGTPDNTWKRVLKQRLEIVPLTDPATWKPGVAAKFQILFEGKPLSGTAVFRHFKSAGKVETESTTTDKDGTATFKLPGKGKYLVRLIHMRRCKDDDKADWQSFWGALSFAVP